MRPFRSFGVAAASIVGMACFGSVDVTKPPELDGTQFMTATVDGAEFRTGTLDVLRSGGRISVVAVETDEATNQAIIALYFPDGAPATYALGDRFVAGAVSGNYGQFAIAPPTSVIWTTDSIRVGSLTITTLTATQVAGTFQFAAVADTAAASPQVRTVTTGSFAAKFQ